MTKTYPAVFEWAGKNFSGYAPDVPGCIATAKTLPLIRLQFKEALEAHLQWLQDDGEILPMPSSEVTVDLKQDKKSPYPKGYYVIVERLEVALPRKKRTPARKPMRELNAA